jgi:hypothetical protein
MILLLGVSEIPVTLRGPMTAISMTCGGSVVPALAVPFDAFDQSCGLIRSSYGPSPAANERRRDLFLAGLIAIGSLLM